MYDLPTAPGALLGYTRKSGRPVYLAAGGSEDHDSGGTDNDSSGDDGGSTDDGNSGKTDDAGRGDSSDSGSTEKTTDSKGSDGDVASLPPHVQKMITDLRSENAKHRTKAKTASEEAKTAADKARADFAKQIGKALGLVEDDAPPDVNALMQQLTTKDGELKARTVELALYRTAGKAGGNAEALLDSRSFLAEVGELDHSSKTFIADLESTVKDFVKKHPQFKNTAGQAPATSGGELNGGSGERQKKTGEDASFDDLAAARKKRRGAA